jgi:hypothetical protein
MIVYLIPVGGERYQLYVELADDEGVAPEPEGTGWVSRQFQKFRAMLAEAEQERLRQERGETPRNSGLWRRILGKVAETIAEQRLLWRLRNENEAELWHPDDMSSQAAMDRMMGEFAHDAARHRRWMIIDGVLAAVTGPLFFLVPGPNVIGLFFTFRAIGHWLSWRGAKRGLGDVKFGTKATPPLTAVRSALALPAAERRPRLTEIGLALGLEHLAGFVLRVSAGRAKK